MAIKAPDTVPEGILELPPIGLDGDPPDYNPHDGKLCERFANLLRTLPDPDAQRTVDHVPVLSVRTVHAVMRADHRGLVGVLYTTNVGQRWINGVEQPAAPKTAWLRGTELALLEEGW
jgi:hypothetical protein